MRRENAIRGSFSFVAAASLAYMTGEFVDAYYQTKQPVYLFTAGATAALAILETWKIGHRLEKVLDLH